MASRLFRKSLTSSVRSNCFVLSRESAVKVTALSSPAVQNTTESLHRVKLEDREIVSPAVQKAILDYRGQRKMIPLGQSVSVDLRGPSSTGQLKRMYEDLESQMQLSVSMLIQQDLQTTAGSTTHVTMELL